MEGRCKGRALAAQRQITSSEVCDRLYARLRGNDVRVTYLERVRVSAFRAVEDGLTVRADRSHITMRTVAGFE